MTLLIKWYIVIMTVYEICGKIFTWYKKKLRSLDCLTVNINFNFLRIFLVGLRVAISKNFT